jgi:hypothetical protein
MRFYAKLIVFIILFTCASNTRVRGLAGELTYEARVKIVLTFGSAADYEALVEDTQRMLAAQSGRLDVYEAGKRYRVLLAAGLADAARRNVTLSEDQLSRLKAECQRKAFGPVLDAMKARTALRVGRAPVSTI